MECAQSSLNNGEQLQLRLFEGYTQDDHHETQQNIHTFTTLAMSIQSISCTKRDMQIKMQTDVQNM